MTPTQFAASALKLLPAEPPAVRGSVRYGSARACWLCGGDTAGIGWPQQIAISPTFTQHNTAARTESDAVCQSCAALTRAESFQALIGRLGIPIKLWAQCGWHSYSHYIRGDGHYEAPVPSRMREILLDPPPGEWLLTLNTSGKKHTIFRARVAASRTWFPVQVDEETIWTSSAAVENCLSAFERLTAMGCGKDGVETGRYHPADTMRAGLDLWRPAEERMARFRRTSPALVGLVRIIARSAKTISDNGEAVLRAPALASASTPAAPPSERDLFA